jgi:hypothetical protein
VSRLVTLPSSTGVAGKSSRKGGRLSGVAADRAMAFLRRRYPIRTADHIAADAGTTSDAARKWLAGVSSPGFSASIRLVAVHGPPLLETMFDEPPPWLSAAAAATEATELLATIEAARRRLAEIAGAAV